MGTLASTSMVGDANNDGVANALDLSIVQQNLNKPGGRAQGDFDGSGLVDSNDLTLLNNHYQRRAPAVYFGKIVDTATAIPGGSTTFRRLNAPVIDRGGNLGFLGVGNGAYGIYRWSTGNLTRVADNATAIPAGTGTFANFGQPSIAAGKLAFQGVGTNQEGIYSFAGGALSKLINRATPRPEGGTFSSFGDPAVQDAALAFVGHGGAAVGAYTLSGSTVVPVVGTGTAIPGGVGNFETFDSPISDGATHWFVGRGIGQFGIYKKAGAGISALLDRDTTVPGTTQKFSSVANLSQDGENLAFNGVFGNAEGVFGLIQSAVKRVADVNTSVPGGQGKFTNFGLPSIGGSSVAFVGYDRNKNPGIYAWVNGELNKVIDSAVMLNGKVIKALSLSRDAVTGNRVVFEADFTDGSAALFSASLLPTRLPGDLNNDGKVDPADGVILRRNFGRAGSRAGGDLNVDGVIDFKDYQQLELRYGQAGVAPLIGDTDGDGVVNTTDLRTLVSNLGKYASVTGGDFNGDGRVDFSDYQLLERNFGKTAPVGSFVPFGGGVPAAAEGFPGALVPEPGAVAVALVGVAIGATRRRRRA
jgi:hypothetical protein